MVGAIATVGVMSSPKVTPIATLQQARQQQLAWSGFTYVMQDEADKVRISSEPFSSLQYSYRNPTITLKFWVLWKQALRLCQLGLLGKENMASCAKHVVPVEDTKYTHTETGQNVWAENQRFLSSQVLLQKGYAAGPAYRELFVRV
jgi:hypothetical protein